MAEITIYTPTSLVRIIRPLPDESDEGFRRRMEAMIAVLTECDPSLVAIMTEGLPGHLSCIVTQRPVPRGRD